MSGSIFREKRFASFSTYQSQMCVSSSSARSASPLIVPTLERLPLLVERADDIAAGCDGAFHAPQQRAVFDTNGQQPGNRDTSLGNDVLAAVVLQFVHDSQTPCLEFSGSNFACNAPRRG